MRRLLPISRSIRGWHALLAAPFLASYSAAEPGFVGIGAVSEVWGMSDDGLVVVGQKDPPFGIAIRWVQGVGLEELSDAVLARGASEDAQTVAGDDEAGRAFRWTATGGYTDLGTLGGTGSTSAWAVSGDGSVVVGFSQNPTHREAFLWTEAGGMQGLGCLAAANPLCRAFDVSADGAIIVGSTRSFFPDQTSFRWTQATGMVGVAAGFATAISADGSTIVGHDGSGAYRWTQASGAQSLGTTTSAEGVSGDGSIVVGGEQFSSGPFAFLWDATHGVRDMKTYLESDLGLDLTGWTLHVVMDVSADGQTFAGIGTNPDGQKEGWIGGELAIGPPIPEVPGMRSWGVAIVAFSLVLAGAWLMHGDTRRGATRRAT